MSKDLFFAIQDSNGRYVDKDSIWRNPETKEWCYTSMGGYEFDASMENLDTGVWLSKSIEDAEKVIEKLSKNLYRVHKENVTFLIKEITC